MTIEKVISARNDYYATHRAIRGMKNSEGGNARLVHLGIGVAIHSKAPPPVEEYDAWVEGIICQAKANRLPDITGTKLRRMVIVRRQGGSLKECGAAVGKSCSYAQKWLAKLPEGLAA